jgi:hypothetical protein
MRRSAATTRKAKSPLTAAVGRAEKPVELPAGVRERIARKAYELWEQRGRQAGNALRDWLDAEKIVLEEPHKPRFSK